MEKNEIERLKLQRDRELENSDRLVADLRNALKRAEDSDQHLKNAWLDRFMELGVEP